MQQHTSTSDRPLAVVTGASAGIGFELAKQFAQNGYGLVVVAEDAGIETAARELEALGTDVRAVRADLATFEGVEQAWQAVVADGRPVDAIAINAGVGIGGDFTETDLDAELKLVDLNVKSTVHLAKRVVPAMKSRGAGKILFTSSIAAMMPDPFEAVYGGSKAFVFSFSEALRNELKDSGVTVTALQPGPTETEFFDRAGMTGNTQVGTSKKDDPALVAKQGFEALMAGKDHVVAGSLKTRVQAAVISKLPEGAKSEAHRAMAEPGSGKK